MTLRRASLLAFLIGQSLGLVALPVGAAWQPNGVLVCGHANTQDLPHLASDGAGGAYILWRDTRNYSVSEEDHYLQHVTANGDIAPGWPAEGVPLCTAPGFQAFGASPLVGDGQGGALAAWWDRRSGIDDDVYVQRITAAGTPAPGWLVDGVRLTAVYAAEREVTLASDGVGGAFVVWQDGRSGTSFDIYAMHMLADGTRAPGWPENGLPVCTLQGDEASPTPIADGVGGVMIVWAGPEIRAVRLNAAGGRVSGWAENGNVVCSGHLTQDVHAVPDGSGGMFISWVDGRTIPPGVGYPNNTDYFDIYAHHLLADGSPAPGWPVNGLPLSTAPRSQRDHSSAPDGAGGLLLVWGDYRNFSTEYEDIYALRGRGDGTLAAGWPVDGLRASDEPGYQLSPMVVAPDGLGGMYLAYNDYPDGYRKLATQHLTGAGGLALGWPPNGRRIVDNTGDQMHQKLISDGTGGAIVVWTDYRDGSGANIYAQKISPDGPTPVQVALVSAEAEAGLVRLTWYAADGASLAATVERRTDEEDWRSLGTIAADGTGMLAYDDRAVRPGARYAYRLAYADGSAVAHTLETWVTVPALRFALRGLTPNPSAGDPVVAFTLVTGEPASLEAYDVRGRLVLSREVVALGPGSHTIRLDARGRLAAGVYTVRLRQGEQMATARAVVIR